MNPRAIVALVAYVSLAGLAAGCAGETKVAKTAATAKPAETAAAAPDAAPPPVDPAGEALAAHRKEIFAACGVSEAQALQLPALQFEFDRAELTAETRQALEASAECLRHFDAVDMVVEGHCDERGTEEYNLALGQTRAESVRSYLSNLGLDRDRLRPVSKGKLEPVCDESTDECWARNRRVQLFLQ